METQRSGDARDCSGSEMSRSCRCRSGRFHRRLFRGHKFSHADAVHAGHAGAYWPEAMFLVRNASQPFPMAIGIVGGIIRHAFGRIAQPAQQIPQAGRSNPESLNRKSPELGEEVPDASISHGCLSHRGARGDRGPILS